MAPPVWSQDKQSALWGTRPSDAWSDQCQIKKQEKKIDDLA